MVKVSNCVRHDYILATETRSVGKDMVRFSEELRNFRHCSPSLETKDNESQRFTSFAPVDFDILHSFAVIVPSFSRNTCSLTICLPWSLTLSDRAYTALSSTIEVSGSGGS